MDFTYLKNVLIYIVSACISVLIIVYIVLQLTGNFSTGVDTTLTMMDTSQQMISLDGYIIRNEEVLYAANEGSVNVHYSDGERVGAGMIVASLYDGDSVQDEIIALDNKIAMLEQSNTAADSATADRNTLDSRINQLYSTILGKMEEGDIRYALEKSEELIIQLNRREISVKASTGFTDRINSLTARRDALIASSAQAGEYITTPAAGFFFGSLDGYEQSYSAVDVDQMTIADFDRLTGSEPLAPAADSHPVGKVVTDFTWYVACKVPYSTVHNYRENGIYTLNFPYNNDEKITATLYRTITEANENSVVLLFQTSTMPDNFSYLRRQSVEIIMESYTGYKVPVSALRVIDGKEGVFILKGSVVHFREIEPIFEKNGYIIAEEKDISNPDHANRLGLYEMIITKGKDYYDGQILN